MFYLHFMTTCLNVYLLFWLVFFNFLSSSKETVILCLMSAMYYKSNSLKYQTVPVILNSVTYLLKILCRMKKNGQYLTDRKHKLFMFQSFFFEHDFLNQTSTQPVSFFPSMSSAFSIHYLQLDMPACILCGSFAWLQVISPPPSLHA